jgi:hypothetical protein
MIHCGLVALVKNTVKFMFALFGFLVNLSEKRAASQKNIQLVKCLNYQRAYLCGAGMWPYWGGRG